MRSGSLRPPCLPSPNFQVARVKTPRLRYFAFPSFSFSLSAECTIGMVFSGLPSAKSALSAVTPTHSSHPCSLPLCNDLGSQPFPLPNISRHKLSHYILTVLHSFIFIPRTKSLFKGLVKTVFQFCREVLRWGQ